MFLELLDKTEPSKLSDMENIIVERGKKLIPFIVKDFDRAEGKIKGILGMIMIRIGSPCLPYLNKDIWEHQYIKNEIGQVA